MNENEETHDYDDLLRFQINSHNICYVCTLVNLSFAIMSNFMWMSSMWYVVALFGGLAILNFTFHTWFYFILCINRFAQPLSNNNIAEIFIPLEKIFSYVKIMKAYYT